MRRSASGSVLDVRAIGGLHVVTLAWDFAKGKAKKGEGLMGFAIERTELLNGKAIERYYLQGIKRFKDKDQGLAPGTPVRTSEHPVQSFQWGDYTAKPATSYRYNVVPVYGEPKMLKLELGSATSVAITTEAEEDDRVGGARHNVYFNRGVAGSQAYARRFGKTKPDENEPLSPQMAWLSRGLFEALTGFIGLAAGRDAGDYQLRAMLYEFRYLPVGRAFGEAAKAGADVDIRYEAQSYKDDNETMIAKARIKRLCKPQVSRAGIRHNKFIVLIRKGKPVAVWTGSTNISAGGIFGHSNVGHVIWDDDIAAKYLAYWERLAADDISAGDLRDANLKVESTPEPNTLPPSKRILTLFCPRDNKATLETLHWYANLLASNGKILCMTFAFNLDEMFHKALTTNDGSLRYAVFDKAIDAGVEDEIQKTKTTVIAIGSKLEKGDLPNFIGEVLTGFNRNRYIHDKFLLVDPLGDDPVVITGTANFSGASQTANDENMLAIRGNTRVADIYFGEFMRVFDHLYARYIIRRITEEGKSDPDAGYLADDWKKWLPVNFKPGRKQTRRLRFMGR